MSTSSDEPIQIDENGLTDDQKKQLQDNALEYLLQRLGDEIEADTRCWFPNLEESDELDIEITTLGLAGEAGEVCDVLKKMMRGSLSPEEGWPLYCGELVDLFTYLIKVAHILKFPLIQGYREKQAFNERRFGHEGGTDQSPLAASVGRQQQSPLGASAFVSEQQVQYEVRRDAEDGG